MSVMLMGGMRSNLWVVRRIIPANNERASRRQPVVSVLVQAPVQIHFVDVQPGAVNQQSDCLNLLNSAILPVLKSLHQMNSATLL